MNKKKRILNSVKLNKIDRIPSSFRATDIFAKMMMEHFKIGKKDDPIENNYKELVEKLGTDFWSSGTKIDRFHTIRPIFNGPKPSTPYIEDSQFFYVVGINTVKGIEKKFGFEYELYGEDPPLANAEDACDIKDGFLTSKLDYFDFNVFPEAYKKEDENDYFVCFGTLSNLFMICCYLMGMEKFLMSLSFNKRLTEKLIHEVGEFSLEFNRRELKSYGDKAHYYGTWDDVAGQYGVLFDPDVFKKYFIPIYEDLIDQVKKYDIIFGWHCCGSVNKILPDMINAGIDVFDVVQTSAKDMEIENIYKLYGNKICLHGGIDIQNLLTKGTEKDIRNEVRKIKKLWGESGGIIIAPSHLIVPDCPVQNVLFLYDEINRT